MNFKYALFILIFLLITPIVYASGTNVAYFFGSSCQFSKMEETNINNIKSYWEGQVDWIDYDLDNKSNIDTSIKYGITGIPSAVIECSNRTIKIDRLGSNFSEEVNQTIYQCQSGEVSRKAETNTGVFILVASGFLITIYLLGKHLGKRNLKKVVKKKRIK